MGKPGPPLANAIFVFILMGGVKQRRFLMNELPLTRKLNYTFFQSLFDMVPLSIQIIHLICI